MLNTVYILWSLLQSPEWVVFRTQVERRAPLLLVGTICLFVGVWLKWSSIGRLTVFDVIESHCIITILYIHLYNERPWYSLMYCYRSMICPQNLSQSRKICDKSEWNQVHDGFSPGSYPWIALNLVHIITRGIELEEKPCSLLIWNGQAEISFSSSFSFGLLPLSPCQHCALVRPRNVHKNTFFGRAHPKSLKICNICDAVSMYWNLRRCEYQHLQCIPREHGQRF
jgi:hypothetical protein